MERALTAKEFVPQKTSKVCSERRTFYHIHLPSSINGHRFCGCGLSMQELLVIIIPSFIDSRTCATSSVLSIKSVLRALALSFLSRTLCVFGRQRHDRAARRLPRVHHRTHWGFWFPCLRGGVIWNPNNGNDLSVQKTKTANGTLKQLIYSIMYLCAPELLRTGTLFFLTMHRVSLQLLWKSRRKCCCCTRIMEPQ